MTTTRKIGHAPKLKAVAAEIPALQGPCVACADCQGVCAELIEVMTLPDAVLRTEDRDGKDRDA